MDFVAYMAVLGMGEMYLVWEGVSVYCVCVCVCVGGGVFWRKWRVERAGLVERSLNCVLGKGAAVWLGKFGGGYNPRAVSPSYIIYCCVDRVTLNSYHTRSHPQYTRTLTWPYTKFLREYVRGPSPLCPHPSAVWLQAISLQNN